MNLHHKAKLTAEAIKARAKELGADLVGIADGATLDANPPDPKDPRRPKDVTALDSGRVIVMATRIGSGSSRIVPWNDRHKYYNDELALSELETTALELVYWLEDQGYPALIVPPTHTDPWRYKDDPNAHQTTLISLPHAAVEAGLGTLGLNLQLLTPEYGPRVLLIAVLCSVDVTPDTRMEAALCKGPECGRCLSVCPADAVELYDRDWESCDRFRSPHGFANLIEFVDAMMLEGDPAKQKSMLRSETSFNLWQSILRGAGVITGCRRCADVCPVGEDYKRLEDALAEIPEDTDAKRAKLADMRKAGGNNPAQTRWTRV